MLTESKDYEYWNKERPDGLKADTEADEKEMTGGLDYVFVYGTLLRGQPNHQHFLGSSYFVGEATTKAHFVMFGMGFPLARLPNNTDNGYFCGQIRGEVYGVTVHTLLQLDRLEGHPSFYERRITDLEEHQRKVVWMYHWANDWGEISEERVVPDPVTKLIDWRRHLRQNKGVLHRAV